MKLFKAIAATAAVITCCIGNPLPVEANKTNYNERSELSAASCKASDAAHFIADRMNEGKTFNASLAEFEKFELFALNSCLESTQEA